MPSKKKKYNARFPAGRIKKIMQSDEEVGKVAQAVPIIISRTLELFIESILTKTLRITLSRNAKTLSPSHMKQCIMLVPRFDFLRELVKNVPDINMADDSSKDDDDYQSSDEEQNSDSDSPQNLCIASTSKGVYQVHFSNGNVGDGDDTPQDLRVRPQDLRVTPQDLSLPSTSANSQARKITSNGVDGEELCNNAVSEHSENEVTFPKNKTITELYSVSSTTGTSNTTGGNDVGGNDVGGNKCNDKIVPNTRLLRSESSPVQNSKHTLHSLNLKQHHQSHVVTNSIGSQSTALSSVAPMLKKPSELDKTDIVQSTAISAPTPAPILGIDFCNKPIVKIDYSNLQALQITSTVDDDKKAVKPATAPANVNDAFAFNVTPVISIDLSNIVSDNKETAIVTAAATTTTIITDQSNTSESKDIKENYNNSTAIVAVTATTTTTTITTPIPISASTSNNITPLGVSLIQRSKNNCHLDLDEDYDNL